MILKEERVDLEAQAKKMNIIIPMAGLGSRLRPITPTTHKPLIKLAGKTIIHRIIGELYQYTQVKNIGFVLQQKDILVENNLSQIVRDEFDKNIKVHFFYQQKAEGTAHAIYCAKKLLKGRLLVIFSDTLFFLKKPIDFSELDKYDGAIFVKKVIDPSSYGVVKKNNKNIVIDFIEKPTTLISKLAIIGVYYFKDANKLEKEIKNIISKNILEKNEYQLTTALRNLYKKGENFTTIEVQDWLDCGSPKKLIETNTYLLEKRKYKGALLKTQKNTKTQIIQPVYIGRNVIIKKSKIGPNVSIEDNCVVEFSDIKNTIIQEGAFIKNGNLKNSILGKFSKYDSKSKSLIIGPYSNLSRI